MTLKVLNISQHRLSINKYINRNDELMPNTEATNYPPNAARDWIKLLSDYREPNAARSSLELGITLGCFIVLWGLAWYTISINVWLTFALSVLNAAFLLRLFIIQHDCGHSSFFKNRVLCDWLGRIIGVVTLTPYDVWRRSHALHHSSSGNLGRRGMGDVHTLTISEYQDKSAIGRLLYRLYRHPLVLFGLGPGYLFFLQNRLPLGLTHQAKYWVSAMGTNAVILLALSIIYYFGGLMPILLIFVPSTLIAATCGVWLFYVQHQFEETHWEQEPDWDIHEAAFHGSSYYVLPAALQWLTGNIGIHHVHHLYSRIPFYKLPKVLKEHSALATTNRMTIKQSLQTARLHLWDEKNKKLVSFAQARKLQLG